MKIHRTLLLLPLLLLLLSGCAGDKKEGQFTGVDGDYVAGSPLPDRQEGVSFMSPNVSKSDYPPVYFGFDSFTIEGAEQSKLQGIAGAISSGGKRVIIAGFTDERGTAEYNRSLGERRALAVRDALIGFGVPGGSLQTVSFGAELPARIPAVATLPGQKTGARNLAS